MERPELSLLLTYAKRRVKLSLLESELLEDPWLERDLRDYFPHPVVERFGEQLPEHPLRRELIATINANLVVNALGPVFVSQLVSERGARPAEVVRAYRIAREVTGAEADWEAIESLEGQVEPEVQAELMGGVDALVDAVTRWYLSEGPSGDLASTIEAGRKGFQRLAAAAPELGGEELHGARRAVAERLVDGGAPEGLATAHALRPGLVHAPAVTAVRPRPSGRSRTSRGCSSASASGCRSTSSRRRSTGSPRRAGWSAGRSRPCARTPAARAATSPSAPS